jgi:two-component system sensor histidine kinase MprB
MTFRHRITLVATAAVAVAVLVASALTYLLVSDQLHRQIDSSLRDTASGLQRALLAHRPGAPTVLALPAGVPEGQLRRILLFGAHPDNAARDQRFGRLVLRTPKNSLGQDRGVIQVLSANGQVLVSPEGAAGTLPIDGRARALAIRGGHSYFSETHIGSDHLRVLTVALTGNTPARAVQIARSLNEIDHTLSNLRLILAIVALGGIAVAALLGQLVSRAAIAPVRRLTEAAEHVALTQSLERRIPTGGGGELSRLAVSFNAMLDALERSMQALDSSVQAQRQLVADASHELRTPITSVRANIEVLQQSPGLPANERERILSDVVEQLEELTVLINDVIELARGDEPSPALEEVRFDQIVEEAIRRAETRAPQIRIERDLGGTLVAADPARLARAVNNLLDNALKFAPPDRPIEVSLRGGELVVRDHGPGIADTDLPHVFDRFYRGQSARALPGSGLGLAIVRQVSQAHGGSVSAERAPGGGALLRLRLPLAADSEGLPAGDDTTREPAAPAL